ncbi:hypothetical protein M758_9G137800 [Ceratodon purpureus]|nr:hypothetical protein M758_9G137800 [Ceratodon purpureus]
MKRAFEQEDLSELLQFLDEEPEGPSHDGDNDWEPELEPKHKVFLSHSGVQKNFTEQLCLDLERLQYCPFFDKRPESLPKGQKFPELIFQAAQQCRVAVLILSEEFFTKTKWPMLELEAFVQSQNKNPQRIAILPVYLGLSRDECTKNETRRLNWVSVWQNWAEDDKRIDVSKWERALKVLSPSNGIEYVQSLGEVALREQIVSAVRRLVPPENTWSATRVQSRTRIYKAIIEKFARTKPSPLYGVRVVGIYGMGGIGKTTFCKVLCDELYTKFQGKVCHGEFGTRGAVELQKQVLRELTDTNPDSLTFLTEDMTTNLLRRRIRQQQVFLALDNVWQQSVEEAKIYLRAGFHHGSIVMVTARSIDILSRLNIDKGGCLEMPELNEEDAKWLFLHHAAPELQFINEDEEQKIQYCVKHCQFHKGANMGQHFHPLALKVLGAQLGSLGRDPSIWVENLSKDDKFNQFREREHPLFSILRRGYDSLCKDDQILFMDGVLFNPSQRHLYMDDYFVTAGLDHMYRLDLFEWLSLVHKSEVRIIKDRLQGLKAKSLLEDIGDGSKGVTLHDLYLEFAKLEVKRGALDTRRWIWYDREVSYPTDLARMPSGSCWPILERISVKYDDSYTAFNNHVRWLGTVDGIKWQHFSNVVVLHLLIGEDELLDLRGFKCLRSLEVKWRGKYKNYGGAGKLIGVGEMRNLGWLDLENVHDAPCFEEIGHLTTLVVLRLNTSCSMLNCEEGSLTSRPLELLNLEKCIQLRELVLRCPCLKAFPDLSRLTSLRLVLFENCYRAREVVGLGSQMSSLQELVLLLCKSLCRCSGLSDLVSLQVLRVENCEKLSELPDLHKLTNLRRLNIITSVCNRVQGFNESMLLEELYVRGVQELPGLNLLSRRLQRLAIHRYPMLLCLGSFIALEELILQNISQVRELPGMHKLTRLRRLTVEHAPKLLQLPAIGDLVTLHYLNLSYCCSVEIPTFPDLHNLTNLENLILIYTSIRRLPGLERLTRLRSLRCNSTLLVELPDLSALKSLEYLDLSRCHRLTRLDTVGVMTALMFLDVATCYKLERLPDLSSCKSLEYLGLCHTRVRLLPEDILTLATLPVLRQMFAWNHLRVNFPKLLKEMSLAEVLVKLEAEQLRFFATSETMIWTEPDAILERGKYRHVSHACMHNAYEYTV